jgi:hypothetical protein
MDMNIYDLIGTLCSIAALVCGIAALIIVWIQ